MVANSDVSFSIGEGEVHALLGENGAGKSTLVKMIYGLVRPDQGRMVWKGTEYAPAAPRAARASGVAMVFQHFSLFEALNVAENVALGMETVSYTHLDVYKRQGAGWLTTEELVWDGMGRLTTHAPSTYKIPACSDRPLSLIHI